MNDLMTDVNCYYQVWDSCENEFCRFNYFEAHDGDVELTTIEKWKTAETKYDNVNIHKHHQIYTWEKKWN
jgi:hypothetical protein